MTKLRVLDLFSGIGGFSLGLERTGGFQTVAFCEIDPFCRRVLAKHWPTVPCFEDVTTLRGEDVGTVDVICGGFPCQDISLAGLGAGLDGARSGLWSEYARLIGELRPSFVLVENVAALLGRGIDRILGSLAALGYDAEWHCIPASAVGAPHRRDRVWILADANGQRCVDFRNRSQWDFGTAQPRLRDRSSFAGSAAYWSAEPDVGRMVARVPGRLDGGRIDANAAEGGTGEILQAMRDGVSSQHVQWPSRGFGGLQETEVLLDFLCQHEGAAKPLGNVSLARAETSAVIVRGVWFDGETACPSCRQLSREQRSSEHTNLVRILPQLLACDCGSTWLDPAGTASETSPTNRLKALGNAVVPQIPELIGNAILASLEAA